MTEQSTDDRFRNLWGRDMDETERKFFDLRESGHNGWFNWKSGRAESDAEVQANVEKRWAENEANGLTYTREQGWITGLDQRRAGTMTTEESSAQGERDAWERFGEALANKSWQAQENRYWADRERHDTSRIAAAQRRIEQSQREFRMREQER